jgi:hypothetical protein
MRVTLTAPAASLEALIGQLPRCVECTALAEVRLNGRPRCVGCAGRHRSGSCSTLPWADAAGAIIDALSPHEAAGAGNRSRRVANDLLKAQRGIFMSALTSTEKIVTLAVLAHWSRAGRKPWPGADRLGEWTSLHPRAVLRTLKSLEAKGVIKVGRTTGKPNVYDLRAVFDGSLPVIVRDPSPTVTPHVGSETRHPGSLVPVTQGSPNGSNEWIQEGIHIAAPSATAPLAHVSPPSKTQAARRAPKPSKKTKPADPEHGAKHAKVVAHYFAVFERKRGAKPLFDGFDGKAVTKLLDKCKGDADLACTVITNAFASWKADTVTIRIIAKDPNEFIGAQPRKTNGRTPPQPNHGVKIQVEEYT